MSTLRPGQTGLLRLALDTGALLFGDFVTKAGRATPYFFNSSRLCTGRGAVAAGQALAEAAVASELRFDMLFGPAYKGIPLAAITSLALARGYGPGRPVCVQTERSARITAKAERWRERN